MLVYVGLSGRSLGMHVGLSGCGRFLNVVTLSRRSLERANHGIGRYVICAGRLNSMQIPFLSPRFGGYWEYPERT